MNLGSAPSNQNNFRFQGCKAHLTYKTHLDLDDFKTRVLSKCKELKMLSFVHEVGEEDEQNATPYEHTHVFIWTKKPLDTKDPRFFDFGQIHPNLKVVFGLKHAKHIVMEYHRGNKTKAGGKKYHADPIFLHQEGVDEWRIEQDQYKLAISAPTLVDAGLELGIEPKSLADVSLLRRESKKRGFDQLSEGLTRDMFKKLDPWPVDEATGRVKTVIARGATGIGKTNWALAQSEKAFKVEDLDELKEMPTDTELIVFDETLYQWMKKAQMIAVTDHAMARTVHTRNTNARIPKGVKRIFTCNEDEHPFGNQPETGGHPAVESRVHLLDLTREDIWAVEPTGGFPAL